MTKQEKFIENLIENYKKLKWEKNINRDFESSFSNYTIVVGDTREASGGKGVWVYDNSTKEHSVIFSHRVESVEKLYDLVNEYVCNNKDVAFWERVQASFENNVIY